MNTRIAGKYQLERKIGSGGFGEIYSATNIVNKEEVAVKVENLNSKQPQLHIERRIYKKLKDVKGFPLMKWYGRTDGFNALVMEKLGPNLEDLFNFCNHQFSLKTTLMVAIQILDRIEVLHNINYIHRDIKPENFLIGLNENKKYVYMVDFGLAKLYSDPNTRQHIPYRDNKLLTGTARYASVHTHLGIEQSRRDDLESLGYIMLYFVQGSLPWQGLKNIPKQKKYERISQLKIKCPIEELCKDKPKELEAYMKYCRDLKFDEDPNYGFLRKFLQDHFKEEGYQEDDVFDWCSKNYEQHFYRKGKEEDKKEANITGSKVELKGKEKSKIHLNEKPRDKL